MFTAVTNSLPMFVVRGDGFTSISRDSIIGRDSNSQLTISSTIQGATPFVFEGGYGYYLPCTLLLDA